MKISAFIILLFAIHVLVGCQNKNTPIHKAIKEIENSWTDEQLTAFSQKAASKALSDIHFGYGIYFRNQNIRKPKDSALLKYFNSLGVYHEDYMSSVVFNSLHRKLNNKPIDLEGQLKMIHDAMSETKALEDKNTQRALKYYNKYQVGDTITIRMPVSENNNAFNYSYPDDSEWVYNDSLDLLINGVITKKPELKDTLDMFFNLKVLLMNRENVKFLMEDVKIGDEIEADFRLDIIEDVN